MEGDRERERERERERGEAIGVNISTLIEHVCNTVRKTKKQIKQH